MTRLRKAVALSLIILGVCGGVLVVNYHQYSLLSVFLSAFSFENILLGYSVWKYQHHLVAPDKEA